jgi:hypothetical protein
MGEHLLSQGREAGLIGDPTSGTIVHSLRVEARIGWLRRVRVRLSQHLVTKRAQPLLAGRGATPNST